MSSSNVYRPIPRRLDSNQPSTPLITTGLLDETPSRTQSALNLTSSTLKGIFSPTIYESEQENIPSPSGLTIQTLHKSSSTFSAPAKQNKIAPPSQKNRLLHLVLRTVLLFVTGMCYGLLIQHMQDKPQLFVFEVANYSRENIGRINLLLWGISGVAFGSLLPRVDASFYAVAEGLKMEETKILRRDWSLVIRSVGAFIGIAFALRKLPWSSTLQASLALSLVNPVLWYLIDRSKSGFLLSSAVGTIGTVLILILKSNIKAYSTLQSPLETYYTTYIYDDKEKKLIGLDFIRKENLEDATWILSILFCSCICFGNIGRRLAPNKIQ